MSNVKSAVEYKIARVPDEVCKGCPQNYEGVCRAFSFPHSMAEQKARLRDGGHPKCLAARESR